MGVEPPPLQCSSRSVSSDGGARGRVLAAVMVMERLADFVSKSLEGGEAPAPPPEPGDDEADEDVDITALEDKPPPAKRPRNWLLSPVPAQNCKRETDDDDDKHGQCLVQMSNTHFVATRLAVNQHTHKYEVSQCTEQSCNNNIF